MINKENNKEHASTVDQRVKPADDTFIEIAHMDVQCHLVIKDKDTGQVLINKRG